jgi:hypothetical protein
MRIQRDVPAFARVLQKDMVLRMPHRAQVVNLRGDPYTIFLWRCRLVVTYVQYMVEK